MDQPAAVLSDLINFGKYARWWRELQRRETYEEVIARDYQMLADQVDRLRIAPGNRDVVHHELRKAFKRVLKKQVLPAMRSLQFAGRPIIRDPNRIYNCGFMHAKRVEFFRELMFLLLGGSGIGYSVQKHHVAQLPELRYPGPDRRYVVQDTVIGWADAVDALVRAYFERAPRPVFDFSEIRPAGSVLATSGGKAPGPDKLRASLEAIERVFQHALVVRQDPYLRPIDVHDIACHIADCVVAGGIRRSAMISLFSPDDREMMLAKSGDWWRVAPQRALANNSAVLLREDPDAERLFHEVFDALQGSGSGEPGFFWTYDREWGTNPCAEISLRDKQFCNLTTVNVGDVETQEDLNWRVWSASVIGTVQATFTDFHYLDPGWQETTERDRLVGVSLTGIASGKVDKLDLMLAADRARAANALVSQLLGISPAARVTTVKPEGTASLVAGTSSGIHAWHAPYYIRRTRFHKTEPVAQYLLSKLPYRAEHDPAFPFPLEDLIGDPSQVVLSVPIRAPEGALTRHDETAIDLLERVARVTTEWVRPGHRYGANPNNVSTTVSVREHEWDDVRRWMWEKRDLYTGLAVLPYDGGTYTQAPFEEIDAETYELLAQQFTEIDITEIDETSDYTHLASEAACAGGACEITWA